jgi:hypothetical protein
VPANYNLIWLVGTGSTLFRGEFGAAGFFQRRQISLHQLPQHWRGDALVVVAQYITVPRNFLPRDLRIARLQHIRKVTTGFGNDLNTAFDEPLALLIIFECFERHIRQHAIYAFDRLDDVRQTRDERAFHH